MNDSIEDPAVRPPFVVDAETAAFNPEETAAVNIPQDVGIWAALRFGAGTVMARPRVLLFLVVVAVLSALPVALGAYQQAMQDVAPLVQRQGEELDFLHSVPGWFLAEWGRQRPGHTDFLASLLAPGLLAAAWFGLLVSAGWMGIARQRTNKHGLSDFLFHGGRFFFPFFRTWAFGLPLFALWTWALWQAPGEWVLSQVFPDGDSALATSEKTARSVLHTQELLYVAGLFLLELALDLGRADMIRRNGKSALLGILAGLRQVVFHPIRPLVFSVVSWALELLLLAGLASLVASAFLPWWCLLFVVPLLRSGFRGGRLAGLVVLSPAPQKNSTADQ